MAKYGKTKNHSAHEEWMRAKKVGRPKQAWVEGFVEHTGQPFGYWVKIDGK